MQMVGAFSSNLFFLLISFEKCQKFFFQNE